VPIGSKNPKNTRDCAISSFVHSFLSGDLDAISVHSWLLTCSFLAEIVVGVGILLESKFKTWKERVAAICVMSGIIAGFAATFLLFIFDEAISRVQQSKIDEQQSVIKDQQSKIVALETRLSPRSLTKEQADAVIAATKLFPAQQYALSVAPGAEPLALLCQLDGILKEHAGWQRHVPFGMFQTDTDCGDRQAVSINFVSGIHIRVRPGSDENTLLAVEALVDALKAADLEVHNAGDNVNIADVNVINLMVGEKL
jgi:hypothetical protein